MVDASAEVVLRALRRTRQVRRFTDEPVAEAHLQTLLEVARMTGSSGNRQPWVFVVIRDTKVRQRIGEIAPYARHIGKAPLAIAIAMNGANAEWDAYDEARVAERVLIAAGALGLGAGIGWAEGAQRDEVATLLGVEPPSFVRTVISLGHPTEEARRPRSGPGTGRRPLEELVRER